MTIPVDPFNIHSKVNPETKAKAEEIMSALRKIAPAKRDQDQQLFSLLYPVIVECLATNVTQKAILKMLEEHSLKLHPTRFNEWMKVHAKKHGKTYESKGDARKRASDMSSNKDQEDAQ